MFLDSDAEASSTLQRGNDDHQVTRTDGQLCSCRLKAGCSWTTCLYLVRGRDECIESLCLWSGGGPGGYCANRIHRWRVVVHSCGYMPRPCQYKISLLTLIRFAPAVPSSQAVVILASPSFCVLTMLPGEADIGRVSDIAASLPRQASTKDPQLLVDTYLLRNLRRCHDPPPTPCLESPSGHRLHPPPLI
jgi:hypothetical protein